MDIIKAKIDQRLLKTDNGTRFFEAYVKDLKKLNELAIDGYEKIYENFQKIYQDALNLINEPTTSEE